MRVAAGILCALAATLAAGARPQQTRTPARIISLVPAVTEMLFAMGAGDRVVGVSSYDDFPPEVMTLPKLGALVDPDVERILALRPDLVVVYATQSELIDKLDRASLPMFRYSHAGLADVTDTMRRLGERIGRAQAARDLASRIERQLADIRARVSGQPRPKTALIFGREAGALRGINASGGVGFLHDLLETAGGADLFADVARPYLQVSTETLLARRPDVIIEIYPNEGWTPARIARERAVWNGLPSLPAVRTGRVYILVDDRLSIPGPRITDAARILAGVLHPEK